MSTHIGANVGDIAESILLPGDPLRAKYIAEKYFENPVQFNNVRGMLGFTGTYKGKRVSAMGTGMGIPSISIYATELMRDYGCQNLIRVGTCGALVPEIQLKDVILAQGACTENSILDMFPGHYAPVADFELLRTAYDIAKEKELAVRTGLVKSSDIFYFENRAGGEYWTQYGVIGVEMEAAGLYTLAAKYKRRALAICSVSDSSFIDHELTSEERERSLDDMLTLALETAIKF